MLKPAFTAALALIAAPSIAQGSDAAPQDPIATATAFMTAFNAKDGEAMSALVMEGSTIAVIQEREGEDRAIVRPISGLVESTASAQFELAEPTWNFRAMQAGPVATVYADYEFLIAGERSHCGTNVFQLVQADGEWLIAGMAYSHIVSPCEGQPTP